ncbi:M48 family metalloprotease [Pseudonocardia adelaidensis]|uniref:Peptidase M48 domain-containing protein n=1 Tax=Pseudonocardia adelaidensis TaxID=648754 RepID=A0ABP9NS15_9PSEU
MIYVWHHVVALVLAIGAGYALTRARWVHRSPRLAVLLWQATAFSAVSAAAGLLLSAGLAPYRLGILPALCRFSADLTAGVTPPGLTVGHALAVATGMLLVAAGMAVQIRSSWSVRRERERHRLLLRLVARPDVDGPDFVLDHPGAAAYFLPGTASSAGCVVISSGTRDALSDAELAAVLAHEHRDGRERHHLVLAPFHALRRTVPCRVTARAAACVELLVEMCADDAAARDRGTAPLIAALRRFQELRMRVTPRGALGAADDLAVRIERLRRARRPLAAHHRWGLALAALAVATTPPSLFVLPL